VGATDRLSIDQRLTGDDISETAFGTTAAKALSISWKQRCSLAGSYFLTVQNDTPTRSYAHPVEIQDANIWEQQYAVIPGDITGTWIKSGAAHAMTIRFVFGAGTGLQDATNNTWTGSSELASTTLGASPFLTTLNATCDIANVKMEVASTPTNLRRLPFSLELTKAQRFYRKSFAAGTAVAQSAGLLGARCMVATSVVPGTVSIYVPFDPPMASSPTIVTYNPSVGNANWRDVTGAAAVVVLVDPNTAIAASGVQIGSQTTVPVDGNQHCIHYTADSRL
jgi:hypothetical protein